MNLKALNLSNTKVNSSALRFFSGLLKLQSLALYGCRGIEDEHVLGNLQNELPNLKCLRLNTASDEDGMVVADDVADDESEGELWASDIRNMEDDTSFYSDHD